MRKLMELEQIKKLSNLDEKKTGCKLPVDSKKEMADRYHHRIPCWTDIASTSIIVAIWVRWVIAISMDPKFKQIENQSIEMDLLLFELLVTDEITFIFRESLLT